ncbi:MAG: GTP-binding protein [Planctomycetaceae bacterium]|nr:GTP-binding protein [Planctomycetaceae bacterium]
MNRKVTRLTPAGRGAVAVLRLQTADSHVLQSHFAAANGMRLAEAPLGRILYGHWGPEDLVVVRTGAEEWEIHCHGGQAAVERICDDMNADVQDAFVGDDAPSSLTACLLQQLASCRTRRTAEILLTQTTVLPEFLRTLGQIDQQQTLKEMIEAFLARRGIAQALTRPFRVAIVGQPNAGKSSLMNALVGYDRAIVYEQPGTTRDLVEADIVIDGWSFQLVDTAGIRRTSDTVESSGVEAAKASLSSSDACLLVVDTVAGWQPANDDIRQAVPAMQPALTVWNKSDLMEATSATEVETSEQAGVRISALTGEGVEQIRDWLAAGLPPGIPPGNVPLPVVESVNECLADFLVSKDISALRLRLAALDCGSTTDRSRQQR